MEAWPSGAPSPGEVATLSRVVTREDIELFTRISGDRNPLHYDEQRASSSVFGGIIVQGGVTTSVTRQDGTVVLDGTATCWTADLAPTSP